MAAALGSPSRSSQSRAGCTDNGDEQRQQKGHDDVRAGAHAGDHHDEGRHGDEDLRSVGLYYWIGHRWLLFMGLTPVLALDGGG